MDIPTVSFTDKFENVRQNRLIQKDTHINHEDLDVFTLPLLQVLLCVIVTDPKQPRIHSE
jgi:hypothetical protein